MTFRSSLLALGTVVALLHLLAFFGTARLMATHGASMEAMITQMDQIEYLQLANTMLDTHRFALSPTAEPEIFRTPGYPSLIAAVFAITGERFWSVFLVHGILIGMLAVLVALLASEVGLSRRLSIAVGALMGMSSGPLLLSITGTGSDILYTLLYTVAAYYALRMSTQPLTYRSVLVGIILAAATLTRPVGILASLPLLLLFPLVHVQSLRTYARATLFGFLAWALVLAPWYVRNATIASEPLLSTVSTFNVTYYNIPMNETFWRGTGEEESQLAVMRAIGATTPEAMRGTQYLAAMEAYDSAYLRLHALEYGIFHMYRTIPFFFMSGFNVANAIISHEAPDLRVPLFPTEGENLTRSIAAHEWSAALRALGVYWFTTLERLVWLVSILAALGASVLATGRVRLFLAIFALIITANIVLVSPVTQARYRVPAEPFIWIGAVYTASQLYRRWRGAEGEGMLRA